MDENMKKFYLKENKYEKVLIMIFKSIEDLIKNNICNIFLYILIITLETFQTIILIASISDISGEFILENIKSIMKYFHFINLLNENVISYNAFFILIITNFSLELGFLIFFFFLGVGLNNFLMKILSIITSLKMTFTINFLLFYEISINLLIFSCNSKGNLSNFPSQMCYSFKHIILIILCIINLIINFFQIFLFSYIFNDFSFYSCSLPWSSPFNYVSISYNVMKIYLIMITIFLNGNSIIKYLLLYFFLIIIIYNRYLCPFYFRKTITIIKLFLEGCVISCAILFSVQSYFNINTDMNFLMIICSSSAFGISYYLTFKKIFNNRILIKDFKYLDEYSLYVVIMKIKEVILMSCSSNEESYLLFSFFNKHITSCRRVHCSCQQIKEIFNKNEIVFETEIGKNLLITRDIILPDFFKKNHYDNFSRIVELDDDKNKLWGYFLKDLLSNQEMNKYAQIELCNIIMFFLKNHTKALYEISLISTDNLPLHLKYMLYISKMRMIKSCKEIFEDKGNDSEINRLLEYNKFWENYLVRMENSINNAEKFWKEIQKKYFLPKIVEKYGYRVSSNSNELDFIANKIINLNSNDLRLCKSYGMYLLKVWRLEAESKNYIHKALTQINFHNHFALESQYFYDNMENSIVIISGNNFTFGKITYCNYSFSSLVGYPTEEIIGKNISFVIPWNIGIYHDNYIENFYKRSDSGYINKIRELFCIDREHYLIPIRIFYRLIPFIEEGIYFIGFLSKSEMMVKNKAKQSSNNTCYGYCMTDKIGKILYYDKNSEKRLGFNKKLVYDHIRQDDNTFRIEMAFPQLINHGSYEEMRQAETVLVYDRICVEEFLDSNNSNFKNKNLNNYALSSKESDHDLAAETKRSNLESKESKNRINLTNTQEYKKEKYKVLLYEGNHEQFRIRYRVFKFIFEENEKIESKNQLFDEKSLDKDIYDNGSQASVTHIQTNKSVINNKVNEIKESLFSMKSPSIVNKIIAIIFIFFLFLFTYDITESSLNSNNINSLNQTILLSQYFSLKRHYINNIVFRVSMILQYDTGLLSDTIFYNGSLKSIYFKNSIYNDLSNLYTTQQNILSLDGSDNNNIYNITSSLIIPLYNYHNLTYYEKSQVNLKTFISSFINSIDTLMKEINTKVILNYTDFVFTSDRVNAFSSMSPSTRIFIVNYLNIFENFFINENPYEFNSFISISNEMIRIINYHYNILFFVLIVGNIVSLFFLIVFHIIFYFYNLRRFHIIYLLTEINYDQTETVYTELSEFKNNFDKLVSDNDFFVRTNQELFIKKNIISKPKEKIIEYDNNLVPLIKGLEKLDGNDAVDEVNIERGHSKKSNTKIDKIKSLDFPVTDNTFSISLKNLSRLNSNKKSPLSRLRKNKKRVQGYSYVDEIKANPANEIVEESDLLRHENINEVKSKFQRKLKAQPEIIQQQVNLIDRLRHQHTFNWSIIIWVILITFFFTIVYLYSLNKIESTLVLISNLQTIKLLKYNYTNYFNDLRYGLINNTNYISNNSIIPVFPNYYINTKNLVEENSNIFKNYSNIYNDIYSTYLTINNMNISTKFCDFMPSYYNQTNISYFCNNSYYNQGFEVGIIKCLDLSFNLIEKFENTSNMNDIGTRIFYLNDSDFELLNILNFEIFNPTIIYLFNVYYNTVYSIVDSLANFYLVKLFIFMICIIVYFCFFYFYKIGYLTKRLVCNKAIFLMIPSKAYKNIELNVNEFLGN